MLAPLLAAAGVAAGDRTGTMTALIDQRSVVASVDAENTQLADMVRAKVASHESFEATFVAQVRTVATLWLDHPVATTTVRNRATWDGAINVYRLQRTVDGTIVDTRVVPDIRAAAVFMTVFRAELFADRMLALKPNARYRVRVRGYVGQKPDPGGAEPFAAADEFVFRPTS
jgi:hypothetical protein